MNGSPESIPLTVEVSYHVYIGNSLHNKSSYFQNRKYVESIHKNDIIYWEDGSYLIREKISEIKQADSTYPNKYLIICDEVTRLYSEDPDA
jgi:hypothetical protein